MSIKSVPSKLLEELPEPETRYSSKGLLPDPEDDTSYDAVSAKFYVDSKTVRITSFRLREIETTKTIAKKMQIYFLTILLGPVVQMIL